MPTEQGIGQMSLHISHPNLYKGSWKKMTLFSIKQPSHTFLPLCLHWQQGLCTTIWMETFFFASWVFGWISSLLRPQSSTAFSPELHNKTLEEKAAWEELEEGISLLCWYECYQHKPSSKSEPENIVENVKLMQLKCFEQSYETKLKMSQLRLLGVSCKLRYG